MALIPAYREAARIGPVVTEATQHLSVIVVDDGSTDATADVAREAGATSHPPAAEPGQGSRAARRVPPRAARGLRRRRHARRGRPARCPGDSDLPRRMGVRTCSPHHRSAFLRGDATRPPRRERSSGRGRSRGPSAAMSPTTNRATGSSRRRFMRLLLDSREAGFEFEVEMVSPPPSGRTWTSAGSPIRTIYAGESSHIRPVHHMSNFLRVAREARRSVRTPLPPDPRRAPGRRRSDRGRAPLPIVRLLALVRPFALCPSPLGTSRVALGGLGGPSRRTCPRRPGYRRTKGDAPSGS